jgi:hypothetical protein
MERVELERIIKDKLASAGLLDYVDRDKSQLLEFPEEFFLETVLKDGSKLDDANKMVEQVRSDLQSRGVRLDSIVRALWNVKEPVEKFPAAVYPDSEGKHILAIPFAATLESGSRTQRVWVDVTPGAYEELKRTGRHNDEFLCSTVADFLRLQLSYGGASYWDPIRYPRRRLDEADVLYLVSHSPVTAG